MCSSRVVQNRSKLLRNTMSCASLVSRGESNCSLAFRMLQHMECPFTFSSLTFFVFKISPTVCYLAQCLSVWRKGSNAYQALGPSSQVEGAFTLFLTMVNIFISNRSWKQSVLINGHLYSLINLERKFYVRRIFEIFWNLSFWIFHCSIHILKYAIIQ